jgi:hypothetical protein
MSPTQPLMEGAQRLLSEPDNDPVVLEAAMTIVTSVRRLAGAIIVIWLLPGKSATRQASAWHLHGR